MVFIGSWMDFRPKKANLDHLGPPPPPNGAILAHFTHKVANRGPKNSLKTRFFEKSFFAPIPFLKGSWMVSRPQKPLETCIRPAMDPNLGHFTHKTAQNDPFFSKKNCGPKMARDDQKTYFEPISGYVPKFYTVFILFY